MTAAIESYSTRFDRVDRWSFVATMLGAFAVYAFTLAPHLTLEWSGVLATSANYAGVGPPPGYPAWTLYSWLFARLLPFGNIAWRVAVGSAVAGAGASGVVAVMVSRAGKLFLEGT